MPESEARRRSREAKGKPPDDGSPVKDVSLLQVTLRGYTVVANVHDLVAAEKQRWRAYVHDLGPQSDEADAFLALITVLIQRSDPAFTWEFAKNNIPWQEVIDAIAGGSTPEVDHPQ